MGRRKYIVIAMVALATVAVSCIKDGDTIEFRQRPTMVLDFSYLNNDSINTVDKEVERISIFIYSPEDLLFMQHHVKKSELIAHKGIVPLYGVPEGDHKVVCIANKTNIDVLPSETVLRDGLLQYKSKVVDFGCDSIFMSLDTIRVQRGRPYPETSTIELAKKYYMVDIEITGAKQLHRPKDDFRVQVVGVPNGFDFRGYFAEDEIIVQPPLVVNIEDDIMIASLALNEFNYKNDVIIEIFDRHEKIGSLDLKKKIISNDIDLNAKDLHFKVQIAITSIGSSVIVKDWELNPVQREEIGK